MTEQVEVVSEIETERERAQKIEYGVPLKKKKYCGQDFDVTEHNVKKALSGAQCTTITIQTVMLM